MTQPEVKVLKQDETKFKGFVNRAKDSFEFAKLAKTREAQGFSVGETPEVLQLVSPDHVTMASVASYKLQKNGKDVGSITYYQNPNEEGFISDVIIAEGIYDLAVVQDGEVKSEKIEFDPENTVEIAPQVSWSACVAAVGLICRAGVGVLWECMATCAATGPAAPICGILCGILVGGGCFLGAAKVCDMAVGR